MSDHPKLKMQVPRLNPFTGGAGLEIAFPEVERKNREKMLKNIWMELPNPTPDEERDGSALLNEFLSKGYVHRTVAEMLRLPNGTITHFYRKLAENHPLESPFKQYSNSNWMVDADFCFVNIRATGVDDQFGNFIQASKMLPAIRASAIHIGPFTDYDFTNIYAVRSVKTISPHVLDPHSPISATDQLQAFVQAAHLLHKAVGYDIEPHLVQFAIPVIMQPELFRWFKLSPNKTSLADGLSENQMLTEDVQQRITWEIRNIVSVILGHESIENLEAEEEDSPESLEHKQYVLGRLIGKLIGRGYWPIPSQSWAGDGVPSFKSYNFDGNYACFDYRGRNGEDQSASAYHTLTPYKFYKGLVANHTSESPLVNKPAVDHFSRIFLYWRDHYDFDFVRYDSVDHIFDSMIDPNRPAADRPTPPVLQACIEKTKSPDRPYIGNLAERMGNEIEDYAAVGFDVILGDDMLHGVDAALLEKSFHLYDRLKTFNQARKQPASIAFCVDTHDTGNPAFWGEPLVKAAGATQMGMRHFLSRFLSVGDARRPKYEAMGSQDLSYGLYKSNIRLVNLTWVGDEDYNRRYHHLEDIFEQHKALLRQGEITDRHVESTHAWWLISSGNDWLVPVITFNETERFSIDLPVIAKGKLTTMEYDFNQTAEQSHVLSTPRIEIPALSAGTCVLFVIHQSAEI